MLYKKVFVGWIFVDCWDCIRKILERLKDGSFDYVIFEILLLQFIQHCSLTNKIEKLFV